MAVSYEELTANLTRFYDFHNKVVILVGAGHGQLLGSSTGTKKLIAVDRDVAALEELKAKIALEGTETAVEVIGAEFEEVVLHGDVVYFEFCLHEMRDPERALSHARGLAPDIVVFEHTTDSEWVFHAAEENGVLRAAEAIERFRDQAELLAKISGQGPVAVERAQRFAGVTNIAISMKYELVLL